jgi:predicted Zn-dependent protease
MILSESKSRNIIERALHFSTADEMRINLSGGRSGNTRFALNSITTSGDEDTLSIQVRANFGKQHASASSTEISDEALKRVVQTAEDAARFVPEDRHPN